MLRPRDELEVELAEFKKRHIPNSEHCNFLDNNHSQS